ncbi:unnamed protein product [Miscanthus lutarioriparius]|uniref:Uncharacterized protein n=1 Tax=Miscanthus lutarioriparius TaxID=422564 RepID=A0A811QJB3_9POAL|nr:unnamed protein product [Miscanthus lutarioriparius]
MNRGTTSVKAARRSRSVDEGASCGGDLPMRCEYKTRDAKEAGTWSVEVCVPKDAVATGREAVKGHRVKKEAGIWSGDLRVPKNAVATGRKVGKVRPVKNLSKLKTAAASFEAKKPGAAASAAGGVTKMEKHAGDVTLAVAAEADTAGNGKEGGLRLRQEFVDLVSSWKPEVFEDPDEHYARLINNPAFSQDFVERSTKLQQDLVAMSKFCAARMEKFHAWVRTEVEEKGYAEVDNYIPEGEDDDFALAFGPMDGVVSEDEDGVFAQAFGRMDGVVAEDEDDEFALAGPMED